MVGQARTGPLARTCSPPVRSEASQYHEEFPALPPAPRPIPTRRVMKTPFKPKDASHRETSTGTVSINAFPHNQQPSRKRVEFPALPSSTSQPILEYQGENTPCGSEDASILKDSTDIVLEKAPLEPKQIRKGANLKSMVDLHVTLKEAWEASPQHLEFSAAITKAMHKPLRITSCMCLGLGSLCGELGPLEPPNLAANPMKQLITFETSISMLRQQHNISHVYFQDPVFNAVDRAFLESRGYTILESPASNTVLNEETYLFMPYVHVNVALATLREYFPMLVLSYRIEWWIQNCMGRFAETYNVLQRFVNLREEIDVPYCVPEDDRFTLYYPSS